MVGGVCYKIFVNLSVECTSDCSLVSVILGQFHIGFDFGSEIANNITSAAYKGYEI